MLTIVDIYACAAGVLSVDEYVPFSFQVSDGVPHLPFIWLPGSQHSLLTIRIDQDTHMIYSVDLVHFNGRVSTDESYSNVLNAATPGLPVVDVQTFLSLPGSQYDLRILETEHDFSIIQSRNHYFVIFDPGCKPEQCIRSDRIGFLQAESKLIGICFLELTTDEISLLSLSLQGS